MNNKRYALVMMVIALLFTSCSENESMNSSQEKLAQVSLSVGVENQMATRAISDGSGADKLVYAIYECTKDGDVMVVEKTEVSEGVNMSDGHAITVEGLLYGKTYRAIFWAQNSECESYEISEDMEVTVDYDGLNNDDARDAFFCSEVFEIDRLNFSKTFTLRRPFAQINVGCYEYEIEMAQELGFDVKRSSALIKNVPNMLDLKTTRTSGYVDLATAPARINKATAADATNNETTGDTNGDNENNEGIVDVSYGAAPLPTDILQVDLNGNGTIDEGEKFVYLSMCYILADGTTTGEETDKTDYDGRLTHEMSFTFYDYTEGESGNTLVFGLEAGLTDVPAQRNWRTNIVGQILSNERPIQPGVTFQVMIDPGYIDDIDENNGFYYSYEEDVVIENKNFVFESPGNSATFTSIAGQTVTMNNVTFSGNISHMDFGNYRDGGNYVDFNTVLNIVTIEELNINAAINKPVPPTGATGKLAVAAWLRGNSTLTGCTMTGTTCTNTAAYVCDAAVVNFSTATINTSTIGKLFVYEHANVTITGSTIGTIASMASKTTQGGKLVIANGTTVETIDVVINGTTNPNIEIQAGATVGTINFNGASQANFVNNGTVTTIND